MTCVFGGTADSWTAALATLGASLLGCGERVVVADLSRRLTTGLLRELCEQADVEAVESVLPGGVVAGELLDGLTWAELSTVLAGDELNAAQRDPDVSQRERRNDREAIREVTGCLHPGGSVSIRRLRSALLVVHGELPGSGEYRSNPASTSA